MVIRSHIKNSTLEWKVYNVKGHQDKDPYKVLDQWASLNVKVHLLTQAYWHKIQHIPFLANNKKEFLEKVEQSGQVTGKYDQS